MKKSIPILLLAILNLLGFIGTLVVNGLANALPINNRTTGELSDSYPNLFVPAGWTFSIWGIIYLLLALFVVYQLVCAVRRSSHGTFFIQNTGWLFILASLANITWIFVWHYERIALSFVIMLILLGSLVAIYLKLDIGRSNVTRAERYFVHLAFSVYLGWITIATIANTTVLLVASNWNRFGLSEAFWTVAVVLVGIAIALTALLRRRNIFFALVVDWALLGILFKRLAADSEPIRSVVTVVVMGLVLITAGIIFQLARRRVY